MTQTSTSVPELSKSYDQYISSGLYDQRYPKPNRRSLRAILDHLSEGDRFLDFGAGTGRYTIPLLQLSGATGVAYDICPTACNILRGRLRGQLESGTITVISEPLQTLTKAYPALFDIAILAFGVLGHVAGRAQRIAVLRSIREMTKPGGVLILGLPNGKRRFRSEQKQVVPLVRSGELEPGDVLYTRGEGEQQIEMYYHLYTREELSEDLSESGFEMEAFEAESILAEETVVGNGLIGRIDEFACKVIPAAWAYGFLVIARRAGEAQTC